MRGRVLEHIRVRERSRDVHRRTATPLAEATAKLATAVKNIQHVEPGVAIAGQVLSAAIALAACFAAPTAASIVAVAAGIGALAKEVAAAAGGAGGGRKGVRRRRHGARASSDGE